MAILRPPGSLVAEPRAQVTQVLIQGFPLPISATCLVPESETGGGGGWGEVGVVG